MELVECPYCEEYVGICVDDFYENTKEFECPKCYKNFEVRAYQTIEYEALEKADCLNGGEHIWDTKEQAFAYCKTCSTRKLRSSI